MEQSVGSELGDAKSQVVLQFVEAPLSEGARGEVASSTNGGTTSGESPLP